METYPEWVQKKFTELRLMTENIAQSEGLGLVEESLKWDQPSLCCKGGTPIRFEWSDKNPEQYSLCFHCSTKLIPTFRELYPHDFTYQGNRALLFSKSETAPSRQVRECLYLALRYHRVKHLPLLGVRARSGLESP